MTQSTEYTDPIFLHAPAASIHTLASATRGYIATHRMDLGGTPRWLFRPPIRRTTVRATNDRLRLCRAELLRGRNGLMLSLVLSRDDLQRVLDGARIGYGLETDVAFLTAFWAADAA